MIKPDKESGNDSPKDYFFEDDLAEKGLEALPELMRVLIKNATQVERSKYLQAEQYERKEDGKGHDSGFEPKIVNTRMGEIFFAVLHIRQ